MAQTNLSAQRVWVKGQTNVVIKEPGKPEVIPSLKMAHGEKVLLLEYAKDAPQNFTGRVNAIMLAYWFHLEKRQRAGKEHS
jgi:hypothetical protein